MCNVSLFACGISTQKNSFPNINAKCIATASIKRWLTITMITHHIAHHARMTTAPPPHVIMLVKHRIRTRWDGGGPPLALVGVSLAGVLFYKPITVRGKMDQNAWNLLKLYTIRKMVPISLAWKITMLTYIPIRFVNTNLHPWLRPMFATSRFFYSPYIDDLVHYRIADDATGLTTSHELVRSRWQKTVGDMG